jgi:hypothetical protein
MKWRIYKAHMFRALLWYTEQLTKQHMGQFLTPAKIEQISRDLVKLQNRMQQTETNSVWKVPVKLHTEPQKNHFEVVIADDSNVLYLDPE